MHLLNSLLRPMRLFKSKKEKEKKDVEPAKEAKAKVVSAPKTRVADVAEQNTLSKKPTPQKTTKPDKSDTGSSYRYLLHPLITEKASILSAHNQYVFAVSNNANKVEIKKAITKVYGVTPVKVQIMNNVGKKIRRGRSVSQTKNWKKAIVTLPAGKTIEVYEHA